MGPATIGSSKMRDSVAGATIEMGARRYAPLLGRFLSVDPVPGGNANDYNFEPNGTVHDLILWGLVGSPFTSWGARDYPVSGQGRL